MTLLGNDVAYEAAASLVDSLSLQIGDLADDNPDHFFMANPVWLRPLIAVDEETFFLPAQVC